MVALIMRPEWYVINTVGVLVSAGTITMLGVHLCLGLSSSSWYLQRFMMAVYKSKHMLELADTMVNLELPVMLVAPQKPARGRIQMAVRGLPSMVHPYPLLQERAWRKPC